MREEQNEAVGESSIPLVVVVPSWQKVLRHVWGWIWCSTIALGIIGWWLLVNVWLLGKPMCLSVPEIREAMTVPEMMIQEKQKQTRSR